MEPGALIHSGSLLLVTNPALRTLIWREQLTGKRYRTLPFDSPSRHHLIDNKFARTETNAWQRDVFPLADATLFLNGRVHFCLPLGEQGKSGAAPAPCWHMGKTAWTPCTTRGRRNLAPEWCEVAIVGFWKLRSCRTIAAAPTAGSDPACRAWIRPTQSTSGRRGYLSASRSACRVGTTLDSSPAGKAERVPALSGRFHATNGHTMY